MSTLTPRVHRAGASELVAYDFGAHLASWTVDDVPIIWCSPHAVLDGSAAIRGGVPICFPWFAAGPQGDLAPSHGLVRTALWRPVEVDHDEVWAWELTDEDVVEQHGPERSTAPFALRYAVSLAEQTPELRLELQVSNPGPDPLAAEVALHTYLGVGDVRTCEILGLQDAPYRDKVTGQRSTQHGPLHVVGETDRVYDRSATVRVEDSRRGRLLEAIPHGATQTVVWNPGADKAATMADLGEAWSAFVCVETAATGGHGLVISPGSTHAVGVVLRSAQRRPVTR